MPKQLPDMAYGAIRIISFDWTRFLRNRTPTTTTVSSVTWESVPSGISFASDSISSNVSQVTATMPTTNKGDYKIVMTATLSNGEIEPQYLSLKVVDYKSA